MQIYTKLYFSLNLPVVSVAITNSTTLKCVAKKTHDILAGFLT